MDVKLQKQSSRQLVQSLGLSAVWLVRIFHIGQHWKNWLHCHVAFTWCQNSCWHLMLPYHSSVFGLLLTKAQQSPSGTVQQSMKSQACFFSFVCFVLFVFWMLLFQAQLDVRIKLQCILLQCFGTYGYCVILHGIADQLHEWCVDDDRVCCRALNAKMFDIDLACWLLVCVASPKIHCKSWVKVTVLSIVWYCRRAQWVQLTLGPLVVWPVGKEKQCKT